jgi:hypothetical protein
LDLGCHLVDLGCWITGTSPERARAVAAGAGRASFEIEMSRGIRLYAECGEAPDYRELIDVRAEHPSAFRAASSVPSVELSSTTMISAGG